MLIASLLILVGAVLRILMQDIPNIEPVTGAAILAGTFIGRKSLALVVPIGIIALSDIVIGNTAIMATTWSAWLLIGVGSLFLKSKAAKKLYPAIAVGTAAGANIFFYLWTNAGVWFQTTMYPKTLEGLMQSYIAGLPFLRVQLFSNIIIVGVTALTIAAAMAIAKQRKSAASAQAVSTQ